MHAVYTANVHIPDLARPRDAKRAGPAQCLPAPHRPSDQPQVEDEIGRSRGRETDFELNNDGWDDVPLDFGYAGPASSNAGPAFGFELAQPAYEPPVELPRARTASHVVCRPGQLSRR